jgi:hypothetical protein
MVHRTPEVVLDAIDPHEPSSRCQRQRDDRSWPARFCRISAANIDPNLCHQKRTVSWLISFPRS